jgi:hypothetical protein
MIRFRKDNIDATTRSCFGGLAGEALVFMPDLQEIWALGGRPAPANPAKPSQGLVASRFRLMAR